MRLSAAAARGSARSIGGRCGHCPASDGTYIDPPLMRPRRADTVCWVLLWAGGECARAHLPLRHHYLLHGLQEIRPACALAASEGTDEHAWDQIANVAVRRVIFPSQYRIGAVYFVVARRKRATACGSAPSCPAPLLTRTSSASPGRSARPGSTRRASPGFRRRRRPRGRLGLSGWGPLSLPSRPRRAGPAGTSPGRSWPHPLAVPLSAAAPARKRPRPALDRGPNVSQEAVVRAAGSVRSPGRPDVCRTSRPVPWSPGRRRSPPCRARCPSAASASCRGG